MNSLIKSCGLAFIMTISFTSHAEDSGKKPTVGESIKKCISVVKQECKSSDFKGCSEKTKKRANVLKCQDYLLGHAKEIEKKDLESLGQAIRKDIEAVGEVNNDQQKCVAVYQKVCDELSMQECMQKKAGQFPSFCRELTPSDPKMVLRQAGIKESVASGCADDIQKLCKLEMPEHQDGKDNMKAYRAATAKYQKCLQDSVQKAKACQSIVAKDKRSGATQLIE